MICILFLETQISPTLNAQYKLRGVLACEEKKYARKETPTVLIQLHAKQIKGLFSSTVMANRTKHQPC